MSPWPPSFSAASDLIEIVPLRAEHGPDLGRAIAAGNLDALWYTTIPKPSAIGDEIERRLRLREAGSMQPFCVIERSSGKAVGMTTYMNIDAATPRLEIGSTWYCKSVQRTGVNTKCKLLLLGHAFETLGCLAVEFRTHVLNLPSRTAIERLGAKFDGILRAHAIMANGTIRDTAVYSIIAPEWPAVKANLDWQLNKPRS